MRLIELSLLGKVYLDLGYLTKSLQVHSGALDIAKGSDSGKAAHQVNFGEVPRNHCVITYTLYAVQSVQSKIAI